MKINGFDLESFGNAGLSTSCWTTPVGSQEGTQEIHAKKIHHESEGAGGNFEAFRYVVSKGKGASLKPEMVDWNLR